MAQLALNAAMSTQECGAHFSHQFLEGMAKRTESVGSNRAFAL
jgi:hypothetical protein